MCACVKMTSTRKSDNCLVTSDSADDVHGNESEKLATRASNKQPISLANCSFFDAHTFLSYFVFPDFLFLEKLTFFTKT